MVAVLAWALYALLYIVMTAGFLKVFLFGGIAISVWRKGRLDRAGFWVTVFIVGDGILTLCVTIPVWIFVQS